MSIEKLRNIIEARTPGPWIWRLVDGLCNKYIDDGIVIPKPNDARSDWVSLDNKRFISTLGTHADLIMDVIEGLDGWLNYEWKSEDQEERIEDVESYKAYQRMVDALIALKKALEE